MAEDTIFAQATPLQNSAIAIVRLSGYQSLPIAQQLCNKKLKVHHPNLCWLHTDLVEQPNFSFDQALVWFFAKPHSFTGEDLIEFHCHGSEVVVDLLKQTLLKLGARQARGGEFTQRAFMNGKINLHQAEAVASLIQSQSIADIKAATLSMKGEFSKLIHQFIENILKLRVWVEAEIDFVDESLDFAEDKSLQKTLHDTTTKLAQLLSQAQKQNLHQKGLKVVMVGDVNVGKSSLMNALLGFERSIISQEKGTTRDFVTEKLHPHSSIRLFDTAGIRHSNSEAETLGIEKSLQLAKEADLVLWVQDCHLSQLNTNPPCLMEQFIDKLKCDGMKVWHLYNKIDLLKSNELKFLKESLPLKNHLYKPNQSKHFFISAQTQQGVESLVFELNQFHQSVGESSRWLIQTRHLECLRRCLDELKAAEQQQSEGGLFELVAEHLRLAERALEEIVGHYPSDELLGEIFSHFCIGK